MRYRTPEELLELWRGSGANEVEVEPLEISAEYESFDDLWGSLLLRVGPLGEYVATRDDHTRARLREMLRERLGDPAGGFALSARAWAVRGRA